VRNGLQTSFHSTRSSLAAPGQTELLLLYAWPTQAHGVKPRKHPLYSLAKLSKKETKTWPYERSWVAYCEALVQYGPIRSSRSHCNSLL
jgi:hypothetical protein